jgi:HemY protein
MRAALLLEQSHAAASTGQPRAALALADRAQDADGSLAPAAAWHATLLRDAGRIRQAGRALERAWRVAPEPALAEVFRTLWPDEPPLLRVKRFERLAEANPDHAETRLAMARVTLDARLWGEARRHLEALGAGEDGNSPTARVCRLMAELEEAERGDGAKARTWLQRAATTTALDPAYVCAKCGAESERWVALCPHCRAFGSLDWRVPARALPIAASLPGSRTAPALPPAVTPKDAAALPPRPAPDKDRSRLALR